MLSVCIPIYNFDVRPLVRELSDQIAKLSVPSEIILIDDHSTPSFRTLNENTCRAHTYIPLNKNIGRSRIRNRFLEYAKYKYLLFLDSDVQIHHYDFLQRYITELSTTSHNILCGGRVYPKERPAKTHLLNWKYGTEVESKSALERQKHPNKSFMTNNFIIKKEILQLHPFDELLQGYGHEDTLMGLELQQYNYTINHIENPVLNGGLDNNSDFISKNDKALKNLLYLEQKIEDNKLLEHNISLLRAYYTLDKLHLKPLYSIFFKLIKQTILKSLTKGPINLWIFNLYKLGIFINIKQHQQTL